MKIAGKEIPGTTFGIFAAIVLAIAYYIGSRTGKSKAKAGALDQMAKDINTGELTYDRSQYESFAQRMYIAMYDFGTDEEALYTTFAKMRNNSDIYQLITTFGSRGEFYTGKSTLPEWIYAELDQDEITKVNDILSRNSITYQF